jgi:hypothetical protein
MELPAASEIVETGSDLYGAVNLHLLANPRPFALLLHDVWTVASVDEAFNVLRQPDFDPRQTIILDTPVTFDAGESSPAQLTKFSPEHLIVEVESAGSAALSIAIPDYPGWNATLDGQPVSVLRAYGALTAVMVPPGSHTVELLYNPLTYQIGLVVSVIVWIGLAGVGVLSLTRRIRG